MHVPPSTPYGLINTGVGGVARTVHPLEYCLFPRSTMPESELLWLVQRGMASEGCKVQKLGPWAL